jgi:sigma-E factor negative regulatory protein RseC
MNNFFTFAAEMNRQKKMEKQVEHEGTIISMDNRSMTVRIVASSACNSCAAKGYCAPSENKNKDICVENFSGDFVLGEQVKVMMRQTMGFKALGIGYLTPFVLVLATLLIVFKTTGNELVGGLSALLILVPYYLTLKLLNPKMTKTFGFTVQKINAA